MRLLPLTLFAVAMPLGLGAQSRSASDISGSTVTSAAVLGGSYVPGVGLRPVPVTSSQFDPASAARIRGAVTALENQITQGELVGPTGARIEPAGQLALLGVLKAATTGAGLSPQAVRDVFAAGVPKNVALAIQLVVALVDMGTTPTPIAVARAARALNAYVAEAEPAFLANPPGEFAAAHAVISRYVAAATQETPDTRSALASP